MTIRIDRKAIGNIRELLELAGKLEDAYAEQLQSGAKSIRVTLVAVPVPGEPYSELRVEKGEGL